MLFRRLAELLLAHRLLAAALFCGLFLSLSSGLVSLRTDFSAQAFFGGEDPARAVLSEHKERWGPDDDRVVVLVQADGPEGVLGRPQLEALQALEEALRADPELYEVMSLVDVTRLRRAMPGTVLPVSLLNSMPSAGQDAEPWRAALLADASLVPGVLSADGSATALSMRLGVDTDSINAIRPVVRRVQATLAAHEGEAGLRLVAAGLPTARADLLEALVGDQLLFVPLAVLVIALLMGWLYRSVHGVVVPLAISALPTLMLLGVMGWVGEPIGLINQVYFTLIPIIAIADAVHLVSRFHEEAPHEEAPHEEVPSSDALQAAIPRALGRVGAACALTTLTTVVGLLSLNTGQMPVLRSFGSYAALGIAFAFVCVIWVAPLMLSLARTARPHDSVGLRRLDEGVAWAVGVSVRWPRAALISTLALMVLAGALGQRVVVDNNLTGALPADHPTSRANRLVDEQLGGVLTLDIAVSGEALDQPKALEAMYAAARAAEGVPGVRGAQGPGDLLAAASEALGGRRAVPESAGATRALLERMGARVDPWLMAEEGHARIRVRTHDPGARAFAALEAQVAAAALPGLRAAGLDAQITGTPVVAYRGVNRITEDLRTSLLLAFVVIAGLISLLFRSARLGAISLLPNAAPLLLGYGLMGAMGWDLEPGSAVVFTMALGIAVDDTIHLLARFREELAAGSERAQAVLDAARHSGRAVAVTTFILAIGFGINTLSAFPANRMYGALGALILLAALASDLLILPALLTLFGPKARAS